ncbi:Predicted pyrophosphatase or phosphodiesterase, AlkP superfamily [Catalinimonas alkaloidigena]|uniref:Predicted pyrophosphatase or phosphodiesterase, AlkP superfamily n=1 Tax=Catalinimonas alkaloidigena TaxID=1075417 RepID=A0A1G9GFZ9_9BACT|nr:nucleotide pyrophosphatase/phosphodiesterase family protein [Catalinimonas alkaloidigena]SDK99584.1 Predicted pyrophosphatase or phosphodiesterase, AlkP superfamily [Catalinimonas alkaloidigena]
MKKTVVLNVVGLTPGLIGEHTPFLKQWREQGKEVSVGPVLPAVTCSTQATYLTGKWPSEHGIVANGWYFRDECEIKLWRQSNKLVEAPKVWDHARERNPEFTCANLFWWYNMYSTVDYSVTPRPMYPADGRKLPDCYTQPMELRDRLQQELGQFPLFKFWGPNTSIECSEWIAESAKRVEEWHAPTLTLIYLPHLDYNMQRHGLDWTRITPDLKEIDRVCADLIQFYEARGAQCIVLSEYGITTVSRPIHINRLLREHKYITVKVEQGLEQLDAGASRAFAMADHQLAHVYVNNPADLPAVRALLEKTEGIELVLDEAGKKKYHLDHARAGELVAVADKDSWFTYYYWLDDAKAPDYARTVDIHRKPGYDPVEMVPDPAIRNLMLTVGSKLLRRKLGFRVLMDVTPLDATLIHGSHGRLEEAREHRPLLISPRKDLLTQDHVEPTSVHDLMLAHLFE